MSGRARGRRRVRDGVAVRRAASAVRAILAQLERLPGPQRDALGTAFGLRLGPAGSVPRRACCAHPPRGHRRGAATVCLVDDAQWLDGRRPRSSASSLAGSPPSRRDRLRAARNREDSRSAGLPELTVGPLSDPDARPPPLRSGPLDESVRERILAEAHGNPLALLELPRAWTPAAFAGGFGLPDGVSVSGRVEESFRRRLGPAPSTRAGACSWWRPPSRSVIPVLLWPPRSLGISA